MIAAGIDLGGTKIETQVFDPAWAAVARQRVPTPGNYRELVAALVGQIRWAEEIGGAGLPVGIGAAGLVNPVTGLALTANLAASGHPFHTDICAAAGREATYVNDCRALALSEAVFGAGRGHRTVLGLILGTGVGGGVAIDGALMHGPTMTGGEFGHTAAPAGLVAKHKLPLVVCGCGATGCAETLVSGWGITRLAQAVTGIPLTGPEIGAAKDTTAAGVWSVWCALMASLLRDLTLTIDPDIIVIGGGLSQIPGVAADLSDALGAAQLPGFSIPAIAIAEGGATSGARGAAYAAYSAQRPGPEAAP